MYNNVNNLTDFSLLDEKVVLTNDLTLFHSSSSSANMNLSIGSN